MKEDKLRIDFTDFDNTLSDALLRNFREDQRKIERAFEILCNVCSPAKDNVAHETIEDEK